MKKIGIIGGAGYTAGELIRILLNHPMAEIAWVHSASNAGKAIAEVHEGLLGDTDMVFTDSISLDSIDTVFLCQGHGASRQFWQDNPRPEHLQVIDLAQDYRDESDGYIYGLPEVNIKNIKGAQLIANPGCFATAIQLALAPLAAHGMINGEVSITGITGATGAGVKPGSTTHFSWRNNNMSVYKAFEHQHLLEIGRTLDKLQPGSGAGINFVPVRGDFPRGIFVICHLSSDATAREVSDIYNAYYADAPFTHVSGKSVSLKQVVNTNKCAISIEKHGGKLLVLSAIDNLLKGASGQAVQNFNIINSFPEDMGLRLKALAF